VRSLGYGEVSSEGIRRNPQIATRAAYVESAAASSTRTIGFGADHLIANFEQTTRRKS